MISPLRFLGMGNPLKFSVQGQHDLSGLTVQLLISATRIRSICEAATGAMFGVRILIDCPICAHMCSLLVTLEAPSFCSGLFSLCSLSVIGEQRFPGAGRPDVRSSRCSVSRNDANPNHHMYPSKTFTSYQCQVFTVQ